VSDRFIVLIDCEFKREGTADVFVFLDRSA
jgi:hypothetical protein